MLSPRKCTLGEAFDGGSGEGEPPPPLAAVGGLDASRQRGLRGKGGEAGGEEGCGTCRAV